MALNVGNIVHVDTYLGLHKIVENTKCRNINQSFCLICFANWLNNMFETREIKHKKHKIVEVH
jgi:hypothetical protein